MMRQRLRHGLTRGKRIWSAAQDDRIPTCSLVATILRECPCKPNCKDKAKLGWPIACTLTPSRALLVVPPSLRAVQARHRSWVGKTHHGWVRHEGRQAHEVSRTRDRNITCRLHLPADKKGASHTCTTSCTEGASGPPARDRAVRVACTGARSKGSTLQVCGDQQMGPYAPCSDSLGLNPNQHAPFYLVRERQAERNHEAPPACVR